MHRAEHVASHMHRMAVFALLNKDPKLDTLKLVRCAVMHDVAEAMIGDLSPQQMKEQGITKADKYKLERAGMLEMAAVLGDEETAAFLVSCWDEYEDQTTPEAKWIKDIDLLEMSIQAHEYETEQFCELNTFYRGLPDRVQDPWLRTVAEELMKRRTDFVTNNKTTKMPPLPLTDAPDQKPGAGGGGGGGSSTGKSVYAVGFSCFALGLLLGVSLRGK